MGLYKETMTEKLLFATRFDPRAATANPTSVQAPVSPVCSRNTANFGNH